MLTRLVIGWALAVMANAAVAGVTTKQMLDSGGVTRSYQLHVPDALRSDRAVPLVLVFHGSGADGASMERFSKFSAVADREGFIVAYPDAYAHEWNDGREAALIPSQAEHVDDVAFVDAMITAIGKVHHLDEQRIFAAGFSNGGIFAHFLGLQLAHRLAAIAPVSGGLAEPLLPYFKPSTPVSVCMIHGAADRCVPLNGGEVDEHDHGRILDTVKTATLWGERNDTFAAPMTEVLPATTPNDHRSVKCTRWASSKIGAEVMLYTIEGGGHGWPTESQAHHVLGVAHLTQSFDVTDAIWAFFKCHPKVETTTWAAVR